MSVLRGLARIHHPCLCGWRICHVRASTSLTVALPCACHRRDSLLHVHLVRSPASPACDVPCSAAVALLPDNVFMSPDFGLVIEEALKCRGYLDFVINGAHRIGIEILRDGANLKEHTTRSDAKTCIYAPLKLKRWVMVDFRQTKPRTTAGKGSTVFVVLSADLRIHHGDHHARGPP